MAHAQGPKEKCFQAAVEQLQKAKIYEPQPMPDGQFYVVPTPGALPALPSLPAPAPMPIPIFP